MQLVPSEKLLSKVLNSKFGCVSFVLEFLFLFSSKWVHKMNIYPSDLHLNGGDAQLNKKKPFHSANLFVDQEKWQTRGAQPKGHGTQGDRRDSNTGVMAPITAWWRISSHRESPEIQKHKQVSRQDIEVLTKKKATLTIMTQNKSFSSLLLPHNRKKTSCRSTKI